MFLLLLLSYGSCKSIVSTVNIDPENNWRYLSKFAAEIGKGSWTAKVKFHRPVNESNANSIPLALTVYLDDNWDDAISESECRTKNRNAKREKIVRVPENGDWSNEVSGPLSQKTRTHFWYFALSDCGGKLETKHRIKVEMNFLNADGSHFSAEQQGIVYMYPVMLGVFLVFLSSNLAKLIRRFRQTEELETTLLLLNIAVGCQFSALVLEVVHLWVYAYNGRGLVVLDFFSQSLGVVASLIVTILFILIASGWTLKYREFPEADVFLPIGLLVVLMNLMIVGLGRITDDAHYKYSEIEGIPGYIVIVIRVVLWGWFVYLIRSLYGNGIGKQSTFILNFGWLASMYLLSQPILLVISWVFATYWRNCVVAAGSMLAQTLVLFSLTHLFSDKSAYYKISTMSEGVLPGKMS